MLCLLVTIAQFNYPDTYRDKKKYLESNISNWNPGIASKENQRGRKEGSGDGRAGIFGFYFIFLGTVFLHEHIVLGN